MNGTVTSKLQVLGIGYLVKSYISLVEFHPVPQVVLLYLCVLVPKFCEGLSITQSTLSFIGVVAKLDSINIIPKTNIT